MRLKLLNIVRPVDDGLPATGFDLTPTQIANTSTQSENTLVERPKETKEDVVEDKSVNYTVEDTDYIPLPEAYSGLEGVNKALNKYNITPQGRRAILAQMGHESGWGKKNQAQYNYGNITAGSSWTGKVMEKGTDVDAKGNPITQTWRVYDSPEHYTDDYMQFIKRLYPKAYEELYDTNFNIDEFSEGLVGGKRKYAESPTYKKDLRKIYESVNNRYPIKRKAGGILYRKQQRTFK